MQMRFLDGRSKPLKTTSRRRTATVRTGGDRSWSSRSRRTAVNEQIRLLGTGPSLNQLRLSQVLLRCAESSWLAQSGYLADRLRLLGSPLGLEGRRSRLDQGGGDQRAEEEKPGEHIEADLEAMGEGEGAGCLYFGVRGGVRTGGRGGDRADCGETDGAADLAARVDETGRDPGV
jgi:hypothetical protein